MAANPADDVVETLRARVEGQVITPGEPGYDEARTPANPHRVGRPVAVVRPANAGAVAETIRVVEHTSYPLIVRAGGHSAGGHSTGDGVLLDLRSLTGVAVGDGTVWAGSGLTARALTGALAPYGRVVGFGDTGGVGIGGITLAGGVGFLSRLCGMTIDNLLGAEIVTADGEIRTTDAGREPDLFWAIRGGGGNFGVVTRFRFRTTPIGQVHGGVIVLPATPEAVAGLARVAVEAEDALAVITNVMPAPPLPFLPAELHGQLIAMARVCYAGEPSGVDAALRPLRELATPLADLITAVPYESLLEDPPSIGQVIATRGLFLDRIDESAAGTLLDHLAGSDSMLRMVQFRAQGGAISRVPADRTAYAYRSYPLMMTVVHDGAGEYAAAQAWVDRLADALYQGNDGVYLGFVGLSPADRVETAYPAATLARLRRIKARYDPGNLFRSNVNIVPDTVSTAPL